MANLYTESSVADIALVPQQPVAALPAGHYECSSASSGIVFFGGAGAANGAGAYNVDFWFRIGAGRTDPFPSSPDFGRTYPESWFASVAAVGVMTLGTLAYGSAGLIIGRATNLFCDTITETSSSTRARVQSLADNSMAFLELDLLHVDAFSVRTKKGTITTVDVVVQTDHRMVIGDLA